MYNIHSMDMVFATEKKVANMRSQTKSDRFVVYIVGMFAYSSRTNVSFFFGGCGEKERSIEIMIYFVNFNSFKLL